METGTQKTEPNFSYLEKIWKVNPSFTYIIHRFDGVGYCFYKWEMKWEVQYNGFREKRRIGKAVGCPAAH